MRCCRENLHDVPGPEPEDTSRKVEEIPWTSADVPEHLELYIQPWSSLWSQQEHSQKVLELVLKWKLRRTFWCAAGEAQDAESESGPSGGPGLSADLLWSGLTGPA